MNKLKLADGTELPVILVADIGKQVIRGANRSVYEFHFPQADTNFEQLNALFSLEDRLVHFDVLQPKVVVDESGASAFALDENGDQLYEVIPDMEDSRSNRDGFVLKFSIEAKEVEVFPATYQSPAVLENRFIVRMAQQMVWEK